MSTSNHFIFPKVEESKIVFNNFVKIRQERLSRPGVAPYDYFTLITKASAVVVMAKDEQDRWIVNEEYRQPAGKVLMCFPAGFMEEGEEPLESAKRELMEETGYTAEKFELIGSAYPYPGLSTQNTFYVLATHAKKVAEPNLEPSELLKASAMSHEEVIAAVKAKAPIDGALLTGLGFYQLHTNSGHE